MRRFKTISEFSQFSQLPMPQHPLVSVSMVGPTRRMHSAGHAAWAYDFYCIAIKRVTNSRHFKLKYGQQHYDFDNGIMSFVAPGQVISLVADNADEEIQQSGWLLLIHPDFLWNTPLAKTIRQYGFWDYSVNEALFLSHKEEATLISILGNIQHECHSNIDKFSKQIIIAQLESLFSYSERYYHRQFITREKSNHEVLTRLEALLSQHFDGQELATTGLPTVQHIATQLHLSPKYLSDLLRVLTGKSAQQHIHDKLIHIAKEKLSGTTLSISEIAFQLGFQHLQSFSKLFKAKAGQSPLQFRQSFN